MLFESKEKRIKKNIIAKLDETINKNHLDQYIGEKLYHIIINEITDIDKEEFLYMADNKIMTKSYSKGSTGEFVNELRNMRNGHKIPDDIIDIIIDEVTKIEYEVGKLSDNKNKFRVNVNIGGGLTIDMSELMYHRYNLRKKLIPNYNKD